MESQALDVLLNQRTAKLADYHPKFEDLDPDHRERNQFLRVLAADARELASAPRTAPHDGYR